MIRVFKSLFLMYLSAFLLISGAFLFLVIWNIIKFSFFLSLLTKIVYTFLLIGALSGIVAFFVVKK